jgi:1-aminocyclopropane-1-carboxylate deaminase/D-cysteine desulfhydrase-like pyridoxal-dependent ACC family enzyme
VSANENMEAAARLYEAAAEELEQAAKHCRTAAQHFRDELVPRGAAHAWAALGHIRAAEESLDAQARTHAQKSNP